MTSLVATVPFSVSMRAAAATVAGVVSQAVAHRSCDKAADLTYVCTACMALYVFAYIACTATRTTATLLALVGMPLLQTVTWERS